MPTHSELVARAERWLRNSAVTEGAKRVSHVRCDVVLTESASSVAETPDAIGWFNKGMCSILIEVKASRADFLADAKKWVRLQPQQGMGGYRYFMTSVGLLSVDELPPDWGLLEAEGGRVNVIRLARYQASYQRGEMSMLWSECRRKQRAE